MNDKAIQSRLIKLLAAVLGGCSWLVLIVPILVYEEIEDRKWKAGKYEQSK
jgi:hypothetical protein